MEDPDIPRNNNIKPSSETTNPPPPSSSLVVVTNNDRADYGPAFQDVNGVAAALQSRNQGRMLNMGGSRELWIPPGFKFMPKDEELIMDYLIPKLWNQSLPCTIIQSVNIYDYDPPQLTERYKKHSTCSDWFFFTPREKKYPNGTRPNRAAGDGFWKATGADKPITVKGRKVGCRKALVYYSGKPPKGTKTNWIMHEYRAGNAPLLTNNSPSSSAGTDMRLDQWVLCRMYQKIGKVSTNNDPEMNGQDQHGDDGSGANQDHEDPRTEDHASSRDTTRGREVNQTAGGAYMHHGDVNHHQVAGYGMNMMNNSNVGLVHHKYEQDTTTFGSYNNVGANGNYNHNNHNYNHNNYNYNHQGGVVRREESFEYKTVIPRIEHAIDHHRQRIGNNNFSGDHQTSGTCFDDGDNDGGGGDFMFLTDDDTMSYLRPEVFGPGYNDGIQGLGECGFSNVSIQPNGMMSNGNDDNASTSNDDDQKKKSVVLDHRQL